MVVAVLEKMHSFVIVVEEMKVCGGVGNEKMDVKLVVVVVFK